MESEYRQQWLDAIETELKTLKEKGTYIKIKRSEVPKNQQILPTKFVLRIKRKLDGLIDKFKARLVVLGNLDTRKRKIGELFSPTANEKSFKLLFAIIAQLKLHFILIDIYAAFCNEKPLTTNVVKLPVSYTMDEVLWLLKKRYTG